MSEEIDSLRFSEEEIEKYFKWSLIAVHIGNINNLRNLETDFLKSFPIDQYKELSHTSRRYAFFGFLHGTIALANPGSTFNVKYNMK